MKTYNLILIFLYVVVFICCMVIGAIYSHDSYSYLDAMPFRQAGYVIFLKAYQFVFKSYFDLAVILTQTLFSLYAVHYFYKTVLLFFKLNIASKTILLALLLFPFFNPLDIANHIGTEGLSYGLYLVFVALCFRILHTSNLKLLFGYTLVYFCLVHIRSQFVFTTLIFAFCFVIRHKKKLRHQQNLTALIFFLILPFIANFSTKSYHLLKDGYFKSTPFGFVNASTSIFYLSSFEDSAYLSNAVDKDIFKLSYNSLKKKQLLQSSLQPNTDDYLFFHEHLPKICNQTIHAEGKAYLQAINPKSNNLKKDVAKAYFDIEDSCKRITLSWIANNLKTWFAFYISNLNYGFYSPLVTIFIVCLSIFTSFKVLFSNNKKYILILLLLAFSLSNALLVAFASHSIMRYLFYNYSLLFLVLIQLISFFRSETKS